MSEFKRINVVPVIPDELSGLSLLSENLWYCWNHNAVRLFSKIDGKIWHETNHNPVRMLQEVPQERLTGLAEDSDFLRMSSDVSAEFSDYLSGSQNRKGNDHSIAYFSAEYGLTESIPVYSGGLGVLSGDHIKSASDLNLNLTAVGLLYQEGYFQQKLDRNGWQQDFYRVNDFRSMPLQEVKDGNGEILTVDVPLGDRSIGVKVWRIDTGRIPIYMLDSNIEKNSEPDRKLTAHLYGGDREHRLKQEIVLGIGGMKVLDLLGIEPEVVHINEGHSAFALFERAKALSVKYSLKINEALELSKKSAVFTTHTPVPAGNDEFPPEMIKKYLSGYSRDMGISVDEFLDFGRDPGNPHAGSFSMTVAAIRNSIFVNGVSTLHGEVSGRIWNHLWKETPDEHTPIDSVTNGIHVPSWISSEMKDLLENSLGRDWPYQKNEAELAEMMKNVPDEKIWEIKKIRKKKLIDYARKKIVDQYREKGMFPGTGKEIESILDPDALTIGFARRFASYKRGDLIFRDTERLKKMLMDKDRPVQLIIAGKAHPHDNPGKEIIKRIAGFIHSDHIRSRVVFLENYNINIGRYLVQGVDLWLNNPIRLYEASGTSGMKAVYNGVLNFSVLDGWWDEGYNGENGWAVGERTPIDDPEYRDEVESDSIYSILEDEIIPAFYDRNEMDIPETWIQKVKNSMATLGPRFNTNRMVNEYNERFYTRAVSNFRGFKEDGFSTLRSFSEWKKKIEPEFDRIEILDVSYDSKKSFRVGEEMNVRALLNTGGIDPEDLSVEVYMGRIERNDLITLSDLNPLSLDKDFSGKGTLFRGGVVCRTTGNIGFKIRVTPRHENMTHSLELNLVKWG